MSLQWSDNQERAANQLNVFPVLHSGFKTELRTKRGKSYHTKYIHHNCWRWNYGAPKVTWARMYVSGTHQKVLLAHALSIIPQLAIFLCGNGSTGGSWLRQFTDYWLYVSITNKKNILKTQVKPPSNQIYVHNQVQLYFHQNMQKSDLGKPYAQQAVSRVRLQTATPKPHTAKKFYSVTAV